MKLKEEGMGLENFQVGDGHGFTNQENRGNPNAKGSVLIVNQNFTDYEEKN